MVLRSALQHPYLVNSKLTPPPSCQVEPGPFLVLIIILSFFRGRWQRWKATEVRVSLLMALCCLYQHLIENVLNI